MNNKLTTDRAKNIRLFLMDVDGVLTDGKMYYIPGPGRKMMEVKAFHSLDGIGLRLLNQFGILTGVISGSESRGTEERARYLGMSYAYQGFLSKLEPLSRILSDTGLAPENVAYMGDDWTDIPVLKKAGLACAPQNALPEVKQASHLITAKEGGLGAVREACDFILRSQGHLEKVMECVETAHWPPVKKTTMTIVRWSESGGKE